MLEPEDRDPPFDEQPVDFGDGITVGALGERNGEPVGPGLYVGSEGRGHQQCVGPPGVRALDLDLEGRAGQKLGDRALADDLAPVDDGDGVARAFDLVEKVPQTEWFGGRAWPTTRDGPAWGTGTCRARSRRR